MTVPRLSALKTCPYPSVVLFCIVAIGIDPVDAGPTASAPVRFLQQPQSYTLDSINHLSIRIAPSLGTQLYFPFVLNQIDSVVPFTINVTNSEVFLVQVSEERNFILISVPAHIDHSQVGSLFIVVADKHLNIRLSVGDIAQHTEAIYFEFSAETNRLLIDHAVRAVRVDIEREYRKKLAGERLLIKNEIIAYVAELAQTKPNKTGLRRTLRAKLHRLYLSKLWRYQKYSVLFFELKALGDEDQGLQLDEFDLTVSEIGARAKHRAFLKCPSIAIGEELECVAVFDQIDNFTKYENIEIEVKSNLGVERFVY